MAIRLASLFVALGADSAALRRDLARAERSTSNWSTRVNRISQATGRALRASFVATTAATAAATAAYVLNARELDNVGKTASRLGESVENIQGLGRAAVLSGLSAQQAEIGFQRMTRRVTEAAQGSGVLVNTLQQLNLDAARLATLSPAEQFRQIRTALEDIENPSEQVRLAFTAFDSEGVGLLNLAADGIDNAREEMQRLNIELSATDIRSIENANDSFSILQQNITGVSRTFTASFAPVVQTIAESFNGIISSNIQWGEVFDGVARFVIQTIGRIADAYRVLRTAQLRLLRGVLNVTSRLTSSVSGFFGSDEDEARAERQVFLLDIVNNQLQELANTPSSAETLTSRFDEIRAENEAAGAELANQRAALERAIAELGNSPAAASAGAGADAAIVQAQAFVDRLRATRSDTAQSILAELSDSREQLAEAGEVLQLSAQELQRIDQSLQQSATAQIAGIDPTPFLNSLNDSIAGAAQQGSDIRDRLADRISAARSDQLQDLADARFELGLTADEFDRFADQINAVFNDQSSRIELASAAELATVTSTVASEIDAITTNRERVITAANQQLSADLEELYAASETLDLSSEELRLREAAIAQRFVDRQSFANLDQITEQYAAIEQAEAEHLERLNILRAELDPTFDQAAQFTSELENLRGFYDRRLIQESEFLQLQAELVENNQARILASQGGFQAQWAAFNRAGAAQRLRIAGSEFSGVLSAFAQHSRTFFELNQAASYANAIVNVATGVTEALKLPFPANLVAAAKVALEGGAAIATISSTSFQGGGRTPTVSTDTGSGTGLSPADQIAAQGPEANSTTIINVVTADELVDRDRFANMTLESLREKQETRELISPNLVVNTI